MFPEDIVNISEDSTKIVLKFVSLILRNKLYRCFKNVNGNQFTVPAAIREPERIELIKLPDGNISRIKQ